MYDESSSNSESRVRHRRRPSKARFASAPSVRVDLAFQLVIHYTTAFWRRLPAASSANARPSSAIKQYQSIGRFHVTRLLRPLWPITITYGTDTAPLQSPNSVGTHRQDTNQVLRKLSLPATAVRGRDSQTVLRLERQTYNVVQSHFPCIG